MNDTYNVKDKAVVLSEKSTQLIISRKKSEIVLNELSKEHLNTPIFFGNDKLCGVIVLNDPQTIEDYQFKNRYKRHKITEKEKSQYWTDNDKLFAYSFKIKNIFKEPIAFVKNKDMGFLCNIDVVDTEKYVDSKYNKILTSLKKIEVSEEDLILKDCLVELYKLYIEKIKARKYKSDGTVLNIKPDITENFVRIRLRDPKTIVDTSFKTISISKEDGIKNIIGKLKTDPKGPTHVQSVLFEKDKWDVKRAQIWVKDHKQELK